MYIHANVQRGVLLPANNTAISQLFSYSAARFDALFSKRMLLHYYLAEGLEESTFQEAREDVNTLMTDYEEVGQEQDLDSAGPNDDEY